MWNKARLVVRVFRAVTSREGLKLLPGLVAALGLVLIWDGGQGYLIYLMALSLFQNIPADVLLQCLAGAVGCVWVIRLCVRQVRAQREQEAQARTQQKQTAQVRVYLVVVWWEHFGAMDAYLLAAPPDERHIEEMAYQTTCDLLADGHQVDPKELRVILTDHRVSSRPFRSICYRRES